MKTLQHLCLPILRPMYSSLLRQAVQDLQLRISLHIWARVFPPRQPCIGRRVVVDTDNEVWVMTELTVEAGNVVVTVYALQEGQM